MLELSTSASDVKPQVPSFGPMLIVQFRGDVAWNVLRNLINAHVAIFG